MHINVRNLVAAVMLTFALGANATVVNVDFTDVITDPFPGNVFQSLESKGFQITGIGPKVSSGVGSGAYLETVSGGSMDFSRIDGTQFDLLQMDIYVLDPTNDIYYHQSYADSFALTGRDADDNVIASMDISWMDDTGWRTVVFDSSWTNIQTLEIGFLSECCSEVIYTEVDNIVVNAVPVPAAFWLFGSALAGLGWMRKRSS